MNKKVIIQSNLKDVSHVVGELLDWLKGVHIEESDAFDIRLSLEEALINAIKHGNRSDEKLTVTVNFSRNNGKVNITVEDEGKGFRYYDVPDPSREENLLKAGGRGVFLIKHLMDNVEFNKKGNRIIMTKNLAGR